MDAKSQKCFSKELMNKKETNVKNSNPFIGDHVEKHNNQAKISDKQQNCFCSNINSYQFSDSTVYGSSFQLSANHSNEERKRKLSCVETNGLTKTTLGHDLYSLSATSSLDPLSFPCSSQINITKLVKTPTSSEDTIDDNCGETSNFQLFDKSRKETFQNFQFDKNHSSQCCSKTSGIFSPCKGLRFVKETTFSAIPLASSKQRYQVKEKQLNAFSYIGKQNSSWSRTKNKQKLKDKQNLCEELKLPGLPNDCYSDIKHKNFTQNYRCDCFYYKRADACCAKYSTSLPCQIYEETPFNLCSDSAQKYYMDHQKWTNDLDIKLMKCSRNKHKSLPRNSSRRKSTSYNNKKKLSYKPKATRKNRKITDNFYSSLFTMIFCCFPLGLAGLFFSFKVRKYLANNDREKAHQSSMVGRKLANTGVMLGLTAIAYVIIYFFTQKKSPYSSVHYDYYLPEYSNG